MYIVSRVYYSRRRVVGVTVVLPCFFLTFVGRSELVSDMMNQTKTTTKMLHGGYLMTCHFKELDPDTTTCCSCGEMATNNQWPQLMLVIYTLS